MCRCMEEKIYSTVRDVLIVMTIEKWYDNEHSTSRAREREREIETLCTLLLRSRVRQRHT